MELAASGGGIVVNCWQKSSYKAGEWLVIRLSNENAGVIREWWENIDELQWMKDDKYENEWMNEWMNEWINRN